MFHNKPYAKMPLEKYAPPLPFKLAFRYDWRGHFYCDPWRIEYEGLPILTSHEPTGLCFLPLRNIEPNESLKPTILGRLRSWKTTDNTLLNGTASDLQRIARAALEVQRRSTWAFAYAVSTLYFRPNDQGQKIYSSPAHPPLSEASRRAPRRDELVGGIPAIETQAERAGLRRPQRHCR